MYTQLQAIQDAGYFYQENKKLLCDKNSFLKRKHRRRNILLRYGKKKHH